MKRILVTGGSSYLGQHLVPRTVEIHNCVYTYFSQNPLDMPEGVWLDIRDKESTSNLVRDYYPDIIIHTAGSNRSESMEDVITLGAENITSAARQADARLIHISTDVIFDGSKAPYREVDPPSPIHAYGRAKAEAERIVSSYDNHVIIRTSLIYGLAVMDLSTRWIVNALEAGESITLFTDQLRNPVWVETLSGACLELCDSKFTGIINIAGRQEMSRAELGLKLLNWWGFFNRENLETGESGGRWPIDCRLDISLASRIMATPMSGVDEVLRAAQQR